jgi:hypothetical protein
MDRRALAASRESFPRLHMQTSSVLAVGDSSGSVAWSIGASEAGVKGGCNVDSRYVEGFASNSESGMSGVTSQRPPGKRDRMHVLCEEGRWQIENSDFARTSTSNAGLTVSASLLWRFWVKNHQ